MIIQLSDLAKLKLSNAIKTKFYFFGRFAAKNNVSKTVLSRQLKTGSIDYSFLVKYLISLNYLPDNYKPKGSFSELFFLNTLPAAHRNKISFLLTGSYDV